MQPAHPLKRPAAVLLDALGTLVALEPPAPALRGQLERRFGVRVSGEEASRAIAAEISYYREHLDEGRDADAVAGLRRRCAEVIRDALPAVGGIDGDALTEALLASLRFRVFDDVLPALAALRSRGIALVVASNWDFSLHQVLESLGVARLLDGIVTSAEVGSRKPDASVFLRALALAGAQPDVALHVGDSLEEDVAGARAAGLQAVLISRDGRPRRSRAPTIARLDELAALWA